MAGQRDTRCISAAFDFLNTDFCNRCRPSTHDPDLNSYPDLTTPPSSPLTVKKSESDTALLECQEDSGKSVQRRVVCLCEHADGPVDDPIRSSQQRGSDFLQGYINRHTAGSCDVGENEVSSYSGGVVKENGVCSSHKSCSSLEINQEVNHTTVINGDTDKPADSDRASSVSVSNGRDSNHNVDFCGSVPNSGTCQTDCANFDKTNVKSRSDIICSEKDPSNTVSNSQQKHVNSSQQNMTDTSQKLADSSQQNLLDLSQRNQSNSSQLNLPDSSSPLSSPKASIQEEDENEDEVVMRPKSTSLQRRITETALISDVFDFLPPGSSDSVFLPSKDADQITNIHTPVSMLSIDEHQESVDAQRNCESSPSKNGSQSNHCGEGSGSEVSKSDDGSMVTLRRSRLSKQESVNEEEGSGDSSDDDAGVYAESFRRSNWVRIDDDGQLELAFPAVDAARLSSASKSSAASRSSGLSTDMTDCAGSGSPKLSTDEPPQFPNKSPSPRLYVSHKRSDSNSTTLSEKEFKKEYVTRRKCLIQRQHSSKEYHRYSAKVYDEEKTVVLEKRPDESDFGLHILDSQPAYITRVDPGSAAEREGVEEGQILVSINGTNVLSSSHSDIVALIVHSPAKVEICVATSDFQPSRDLQASIIEGHMQKQGGSSSVIMRRWKKRYFILRQDSCLYYYKQRDDSDPLGAIPLAGYTFSRHLDSGRDFCFKAEKYGARTYYFMTESRDDMTEWVGALSEAAAKSKKRKDSFVSVSSHNVGLPALEVRRPECTGYLLKVGNRRRTWNRRYCILKDACLYYYKNMNSLSALGVAHLHGYKVDPSISIGKKHAFGLVPPVDAMRNFQFSAENDTDRQRWVDAMIRSIQRWIQIDNDC